MTLGEVANVAIESGPPQIRRDDVQRRVVIQSNVQGRDMGSVVVDIWKAIGDKMDLPTVTRSTLVISSKINNEHRNTCPLSSPYH
jgi:Cu/Ag efflux pump CusA